MTQTMLHSVRVREVGLRDGLQIVSSFLPTASKQRWMDECVAAGFRDMEICSFVPEKYIAQFRDAPEVTRHARTHPSLTGATLVPNLRGAQRALDNQTGKLLCIVSATESFSNANLKRSKQQSMDELRDIVQLRNDRANAGARRVPIEVGISVSFGCPFEGRVQDRQVIDCALAAVELGAEEISLADTAGCGDPAQVSRLYRALSSELPGIPLAAHFHDTRGTGLANVHAALEAGVRSFDASIGGLGGCPNSPGATGNIAAEDLIFMLEAMGLDTGVDIQRVSALRELISTWLPHVRMFGRISSAGLPKGFVTARSQHKMTAQ